MTSTAFLPADYKAPAKSGGYFKMPKEGKYVIRVLSDSPVFGWTYWHVDEKVPRRFPFDKEPSVAQADIQPNNGKPGRVSFMWVLVVYDYEDEKAKIWEITQSTIYNKLEAITCNDRWGHPSGYDIEIERTKDAKGVGYNVIALPPHQPFDESLAPDWRKINLDSYMAGGNPFDGNSSTAPTRKRKEILRESLAAKNLQWSDVAESLATTFKVGRIGELSDFDFDTFVEMIDGMQPSAPADPAPPARKGAAAKPAAPSPVPAANAEPDFDDIPF